MNTHPRAPRLLSTFSLLLASLALLPRPAAAQDWAKARLNASPRHAEWVPIRQGGRTLQCFVVYPEVKDKAPAVLVIHEIFGLSDWARTVADQLAAAGYIAIAPDLVSGLAPGGGGTAEFSGRDAVTKAVSGLPPAQVASDLDAAADYVKGLPAANGRLFVAGFCWGGGQSFRFATTRPDLKAAFVFYGPPPPAAAMAAIGCPVYGFYGGNDSRITSTVPSTTELMGKAGKAYFPVIYTGAGHGFMRDGEDPASKNPANKTAHDAGWTRMLAVLRGDKAVAAGSAIPLGRGADGRRVAQAAPLELCGGQ
jgi:carboxymethylenebutenolidase